MLGAALDFAPFATESVAQRGSEEQYRPVAPSEDVVSAAAQAGPKRSPGAGLAPRRAGRNVFPVVNAPTSGPAGLVPVNGDWRLEKLSRGCPETSGDFLRSVGPSDVAPRRAGPHVSKEPGHWRGFSVTRHRFLMGGPERHTAPRASVFVVGQMRPPAPSTAWQSVSRSWDSGDAQGLRLAAFLKFISKRRLGLLKLKSPKERLPLGCAPSPSVFLPRPSAPPLVAALRSLYQIQASTTESSSETAWA